MTRTCEIPSLVFTGNLYCSLKGPFCDVCHARGPSLGGPGGWFLCPLAMAHCRLAGASVAQHREVPECARWVCTLRKESPRERSKRSVLGSRGTTKRSVSGGRTGQNYYSSPPARATHEDSLRDSRRGARMLGGEPQGSGVLVLAVARVFSAANLVVSAKCAAAGRPFWRPCDATQARAAAATCCRCSRPGCSSRWRPICRVRRVAFFGRRRERRARAVVSVTQARAAAVARRRRPRLRCSCCRCRDDVELSNAKDRVAVAARPRASRRARELAVSLLAAGCCRPLGPAAAEGAGPPQAPWASVAHTTPTVSTVCVSMVCVSAPSRNLASPETARYCSTIPGTGTQWPDALLRDRLAPLRR